MPQQRCRLAWRLAWRCRRWCWVLHQQQVKQARGALYLFHCCCPILQASRLGCWWCCCWRRGCLTGLLLCAVGWHCPGVLAVLLLRPLWWAAWFATKGWHGCCQTGPGAGRAA